MSPLSCRNAQSINTWETNQIGEVPPIVIRTNDSPAHFPIWHGVHKSPPIRRKDSYSNAFPFPFSLHKMCVVEFPLLFACKRNEKILFFLWLGDKPNWRVKMESGFQSRQRRRPTAPWHGVRCFRRKLKFPFWEWASLQNEFILYSAEGNKEENIFYFFQCEVLFHFHVKETR